MAQTYRVGIIGCGRPRSHEAATGFGMSHAHARGFERIGQCELACVADISRENAEAFAAEHGNPAIYLDYHEMLEREKPDIVSICTWPHLHAPMVIAAAEGGAKAIHCEKPMAPTWGEARAMARACDEQGVQLTFNHQRRLLAPFQTARRLVRDGEIGDLRRIEGSCGDIIDWGTHWLDMFFFYNGETPAEWVIGQIDSRSDKKIFGLPVEDQAICHFKFQNEVRGLLITGYQAEIGCANRLVGSTGVIEVHNGAPHVRVRAEGDATWRNIDTPEGLHGGDAIDRGIADLIRCLESGEEPELSSRRALRATEVIFATYESSRRRGRVDLPLAIEDSPFIALLAAGEVGPRGRGNG